MSVDWSAVLQVAQESDEYHVPVTRTHHRSTAPTSARSRRALFVSRGSDQRDLVEAVWWIGIGPFRAALLRWTGSGYDLVLLTNFLHHFDQETCVGLLERARRSLGEGGRVLAVEFVPNEDRVSPPFPAMFAVMMLGSTPSGDAYAAREFEEMGRAAGFARIRVDPLPPSPQSLVTFEQA